MNSILLAVTAAKASPAPAPASPHAAVSPPPATLAPQILPQLVPQTWFQEHLAWLTHGVAGLFMLTAVGLIILLAVQTTKQEGLSGTIGGRVESAYHGRIGAEETLKRITGVVAVTFVLCALVLAITGI